MPVLSDRFSAYPVSVTLNGSGGGTVQFQATGKNIRVTNLYVSVSTRTLQATCTMYKGQIGAQYAIKSTNSGSTGAAAAGSIDLLDGESLYVVWAGGDVGAIATATFTGIALPFSQTPEAGTSFLWDDPIAAGDGSLIYPGLQSIDFIAGISGWRIERDGNVEFNDGVFRGTLEAGNGTVVINELGIYVTDDNSPKQNVILRDGGFIARNTPDNGEYTQMSRNGLVISPVTTSPNGFTSADTRFDLIQFSVGAEDFNQANMVAGSIDGEADANFLARSAGSSGTVPYAQVDASATGQIDLTADTVHVLNRLINDETSMDYASTQLFTTSIAVLAADVSKALGATNYPVAFPSGHTIMGFANIRSGSGATAAWYVRFLPVSNTQYNLVVYRPAAGAASTLDIDIVAFIV